EDEGGEVGEGQDESDGGEHRILQGLRWNNTETQYQFVEPRNIRTNADLSSRIYDPTGASRDLRAAFDRLVQCLPGLTGLRRGVWDRWAHGVGWEGSPPAPPSVQPHPPYGPTHPTLTTDSGPPRRSSPACSAPAHACSSRGRSHSACNRRTGPRCRRCCRC